MVFDYIYYRLLKQYSKQKWNNNPCASACLFLCTIQFLIVYCICMFFRPIFVPEGSDPNRTVTFVAAIVVMVSLYVFDYSRYKNKATELERKYSSCQAIEITLLLGNLLPLRLHMNRNMRLLAVAFLQ